MAAPVLSIDCVRSALQLDPWMHLPEVVSHLNDAPQSSSVAQVVLHVRAPMVELIERLARDMRSFAPELACDPKISMFRVYRDTRFSSDKRPYKTHVAARFPIRTFPRGEGAGLYMEIAPGWVWMGGGMYMPTTADLHDIRAQIVSTYPRFHRLVSSPPFTRCR